MGNKTVLCLKNLPIRRYSTGPVSPDTIVKRIAGDLRVPEKGNRTHRTFMYFDTFDWRLYTAGYTCFLDRNSMWIEDLHRRTVLWRSTPPPPQREYRLHDLPEGDLKDRIGTIIGIRALLRIAEISETRTEYQILNTDRKCIASMIGVSYRVTVPDSLKEGRSGTLQLEPLRGYLSEAELTHSALLAEGARESNQDLPTLYLSPFNVSPKGYTGRSQTTMFSGMSIREATRTVTHALLTDITRNEPGIVDDLDTEFLHEFRVAVRRYRAFLSDIKRILHTDPRDTIRGILRELGTATNRLRDLDVLLMAHSYYRTLLPESLVPGLDALFGKFTHERTQEQENLREYLSSEEYRRRVRLIEELIGNDDTFSEDALESVEEFARRSIRKRIGKLEKAVAGFSEYSSSGDVHSLRIRIKKLRYLIEFYTGVLPAGKSKRAVRVLRGLQDILGRYNDLTVQIDLLDRYRIVASEPGEMASLGGLMAILYRMQNEEWIHLKNHADDLVDEGVFEAIERLGKL